MKTDKQKYDYLAPQCEAFAVQFEGVIAASGGEYSGWTEEDI